METLLRNLFSPAGTALKRGSTVNVLSKRNTKSNLRRNDGKEPAEERPAHSYICINQLIPTRRHLLLRGLSASVRGSVRAG